MPPPPERHVNLAHFVVKVAGRPLEEELSRRMSEVVVESALHMPDMAVIRLSDHEPDRFEKAFELGDLVEIDVLPLAGGERRTLFKGEVISLEPEFCRNGSVTWCVRAYDKSHRLHLNRTQRSFQRSSDSDVIKKVASEAGVRCDVMPSGLIHPLLWQDNQTAWEFIRERAAAAGMYLYFDGDVLCLKDRPPERERVQLKWRENLKQFTPRVSLAGQREKVVYQGWDQVKKKVIKGQAKEARSTSNQGGIAGDGGGVSRKVLRVASDSVIIDNALESEKHAQDAAKACKDIMQSEFVEAEGTCTGDPRIKAGVVVELQDLGKKFSGAYHVTSASHVYDPESGYETTFCIHGRRPDTLYDLLGAGGDGAGTRQGAIAGVAPAVVTSVSDDKNLGRIKVKYPWLSDEFQSDWVRVAAPGAGKERGLYFLPEVGDEVLVAFDHGDIERPYVLGGLWSEPDAPVKKNSEILGGDKKVNERIIKSRSGHIIALVDAQGKEQIIVRDKTGKNEIVINSSDNAMQLNAEGALTIKAKGDLTIDAQGKVAIKGKAGVDMSSDASVAVKGNGTVEVSSQAQLSLKGTAGTAVESSGPTSVKGALVQINGNGPVTVSGNPIMLN